MTKISHQRKGGIKLQQVKFLFGEKLQEKNPTIQPGTIYLDIATGEMYYDDPSAVKSAHQKIIDTATLIYTIETNSITFPSPGNEDENLPGVNASGATTAALGTAILGTMILGMT